MRPNQQVRCGSRCLRHDSFSSCFLHVSPILAPSSTSLGIATIWLSLNLDFFMWRLHRLEFSTPNWYRFSRRLHEVDQYTIQTHHGQHHASAFRIWSMTDL